MYQRIRDINHLRSTGARLLWRSLESSLTLVVKADGIKMIKRLEDGQQFGKIVLKP